MSSKQKILAASILLGTISTNRTEVRTDDLTVKATFWNSLLPRISHQKPTTPPNLCENDICSLVEEYAPKGKLSLKKIPKSILEDPEHIWWNAKGKNIKAEQDVLNNVFAKILSKSKIKLFDVCRYDNLWVIKPYYDALHEIAYIPWRHIKCAKSPHKKELVEGTLMLFPEPLNREHYLLFFKGDGIEPLYRCLFHLAYSALKANPSGVSNPTDEISQTEQEIIAATKYIVLRAIQRFKDKENVLKELKPFIMDPHSSNTSPPKVNFN